MKVLVTGGYFDGSGECFVDEVDFDRGTSRRVVRHIAGEERRVRTKGFTGGTWVDSDTLLVCSYNALHRFDALTWRETGRIESPDFNDLHHVSVEPEAERILLCNTGLDSIEVFDYSGRFLGRHATSPAWFERARIDGRSVSRNGYETVLDTGWQGAAAPPDWQDAQGDYYTGLDPRGFNCSVVRDYLHPNHVVSVDGHLAVTMLAPRAVRCLRTFRDLIRTAGHPHDGFVEGDHFWTTETNGRVTAWRRGTTLPWATFSERYEVFETGVTGWCRGVFVEPDTIVVGLTAIRNTPQYHWSDRPIASTSTSVVMLERGSGRLLARINIGEPGRHSKVFSILASR